jgi:hypothetical protein
MVGKETFLQHCRENTNNSKPQQYLCIEKDSSKQRQPNQHDDDQPTP